MLRLTGFAVTNLVAVMLVVTFFFVDFDWYQYYHSSASIILTIASFMIFTVAILMFVKNIEIATVRTPILTHSIVLITNTKHV